MFVENADLYVGDLEARVNGATEEVEDLLALLEEAYVGSFTYEMRLYAPVELRRLFEDAGLEDVRTSATLDGEERRRESTDVVVLGRAPA